MANLRPQKRRFPGTRRELFNRWHNTAEAMRKLQESLDQLSEADGEVILEEKGSIKLTSKKPLKLLRFENIICTILKLYLDVSSSSKYPLRSILILNFRIGDSKLEAGYHFQGMKMTM